MNPSDFFAAEEERERLMNRRVKVVLTKEQYQYAYRLAEARNKKEKRFGGMTYGEVRGSLEAHLIGVVPELAVNILGGGQLDTRIFEDHGDEGIDTELPGLGLCGIKTTTYKDNPFLRVEINHFRDDIDAYILCCYDIEMYEEVIVVGWATTDEVKQGTQQQFVSGGPLNYVLKEKDLHEWNHDR